MAPRENNKTTVLRKGETRERRQTSPHQQQSFAVLVMFCLEHGIGTYIGTASSTGGVKFRLYWNRDSVETYLAVRDDPEEVMGEAVEAMGDDGLLRAWRAWLRANPLSGPETAAGEVRGVETLPPLPSKAQKGS